MWLFARVVLSECCRLDITGLTLSLTKATLYLSKKVLRISSCRQDLIKSQRHKYIKYKHQITLLEDPIKDKALLTPHPINK